MMKSAFKVAAFLSIALISSAIGQQISGGGGGAGGTPGGAANSIQYNNSSAFGGAAILYNTAANGGFAFPAAANFTLADAQIVFDASPTSNSAAIVGFNNQMVFHASGNPFLYLTNNFIEMTANMGVNWSTSTATPTSSPDTGVSRNAAGVVEINNGTAGTLRDIIVRTLTATTLASDATHTDATVCVDSSSGLFYKGSGTIGICLGTSSARFKDAIKPLGDSLMQIAALSPKSFRYRKGYGDDGAKEQVGFLAEDVVNVVPELVGLDAEGKPNSVDLVGMIPILVKAVQEQQTVIECLRAKRNKC